MRRLAGQWPVAGFGRWAGRRTDRAALDRELLPLLEGLAATLRAGLTPARAFAHLATSGPGAVREGSTGPRDPTSAVVDRAGRSDPLAALRGLLAAEAARGARLEPAWRAAAERSGSPALQAVAEGWGLSERHGAPVVDVLDALVGALRDRMRTEAAVETALAAPRATARLLAVLPVGVSGSGELVGVHPLAVLVGTGAGPSGRGARPGRDPGRPALDAPTGGLGRQLVTELLVVLAAALVGAAWLVWPRPPVAARAGDGRLGRSRPAVRGFGPRSAHRGGSRGARTRAAGTGSRHGAGRVRPPVGAVRCRRAGRLGRGVAPGVPGRGPGTVAARGRRPAGLGSAATGVRRVWPAPWSWPSVGCTSRIGREPRRCGSPCGPAGTGRAGGGAVGGAAGAAARARRCCRASCSWRSSRSSWVWPSRSFAPAAEVMERRRLTKR